jgi:drug/metabolite transporter (DMT)-like permease
MFKGISFALGALFIWAFIYVVPQFITGFSSIEIALGRYLVYGIISVLLFLRSKSKGGCNFSRDVWIKALYFSLICTIGYYTFLVLALRYSSPAVCALILGTSPITTAIYGNWMQKEISFKKLILPCILIFAGLIIMNFPNINTHVEEHAINYFFGLVCSVFALAAWTWYVEANSRFLKENPEVPSSDWCTLIGIGTLFWVVLFTIVLALFFENQLHFDKYIVYNSDMLSFIIGSLILGIFCSWVAEYLWNEASLFLPVSLAGQLTIFETAFALLFVYLIEQRPPVYIEVAGMGLQLFGILYGIQQFSKREKIKLAVQSGKQPTT